ncbi:MAG: hypothetical protein ACR2H0_01905 [Candidatus Limnocylindrales bacterium]
MRVITSRPSKAIPGDFIAAAQEQGIQAAGVDDGHGEAGFDEREPAHAERETF